MNNEKNNVLIKLSEACEDHSLSLSESLWVVEQFLFGIADAAEGLQKNCIDTPDKDIGKSIELLRIARAKIMREGA